MSVAMITGICSRCARMARSTIKDSRLAAVSMTHEKGRLATRILPPSLVKAQKKPGGTSAPPSGSSLPGFRISLLRLSAVSFRGGTGLKLKPQFYAISLLKRSITGILGRRPANDDLNTTFQVESQFQSHHLLPFLISIQTG